MHTIMAAIIASAALLQVTAAGAAPEIGSSSGVYTPSRTELKAFNALDRLSPNANSCPPDVPEPIWGPGNALLGYQCIRQSNGG